MQRYIEWIVSHPKIVILCTALITAAALFNARSIKVVIDTAKLMPQSNPYVAGSNKIEHIFGLKHVVVIGVSPKKGSVYQPAVLETIRQLTQALRNVKGVVKKDLLSFAAKRAKNIEGTTQGLDVTRLLPYGPITPATATALRAAIAKNPIYQNLIVSPHGRTAAIMVDFKSALSGYTAMMNKIKPVLAAHKTPGIRFYVAGEPMYLAHLEQDSQRMVFLLPISFLVLSLVLYRAFRTYQGMFLPLLTALLAVMWGVGVMGAFHIPMDAFNATTPILILALATGHAVQLLKRYYEDYGQLCDQNNMDRFAANRQAVITSVTKVGPAMIAAGTVAMLGFFSLIVFKITAVRNFGIFTGLGILSTLVVELTFIPALRSMLPPPRITKIAGAGHGWARVTQRIADVVTGPRRKNIYIAAIAILAFAIAGAFRVVNNNSVKRYFSPSLSFQHADRYLNRHLGGTNTVYVMLTGKSPGTIKDPSVLKSMVQLETFLQARRRVGKTFSIADLIMRMNEAMHADNPAFYRIPASKALVSQYLFLYSMSGSPGDFDSYVNYNYRRANIAILTKTDSTAYTQGLIRKIRAFAARHFGSNVRVQIGGSAPEDFALNQVMVHEKLLNILQIALVVLILSSLVFRSLVAGILVLTPLLMAVIINFGIMGWGGILLNIPTSLTSAMAVGIGADYAIYLLFRLREELARTDSQRVAVRNALQSAGEAILFAASAMALGYGVLLFDIHFYIHVWLAILIGAAMLVSAFAALVLVPSFILSFNPAFLAKRNLGLNGVGDKSAAYDEAGTLSEAREND